MKKFSILLLVLVIAAGCLFAEGEAEEPATSEAMAETPATSEAMATEDFHIGIVTGTVSQSEDDLRGAEALIAEYGSVNDGGMIQHITYPDNFMDEQETVIAGIAGLADDPMMKAIIVNQAIPGTTEAFRKVKEINKNILCIAGEAHEDPGVIQTAADLTINNNFLSRGYLIINTAHELGCKTFVHISFPRHMSYETLSSRAAIMEKTCEHFGMKYVFQTAPDPTSDVGVAGAQQFILQQLPAWVELYGEDAAFFCTNDAHTEPLLKQLLEYGGYFIEADLPSPLMGYPGALGIDLTAEAGDFPAILAKVEETVVAKGGAGRFGTWAYSYGFTNSVALGQHAINVVKGESELTKISDIMKAYQKYTPGAAWNGSYYSNPTTGVRVNNHILIYQDTYIMGKGYMHATDIEVPEEFLKVN